MDESPQEFHPRGPTAANKWDAIVLITDVILLYFAYKQLLEQQGSEASCLKLENKKYKHANKKPKLCCSNILRYTVIRASRELDYEPGLTLERSQNV